MSGRNQVRSLVLATSQPADRSLGRPTTGRRALAWVLPWLGATACATAADDAQNSGFASFGPLATGTSGGNSSSTTVVGMSSTIGNASTGAGTTGGLTTTAGTIGPSSTSGTGPSSTSSPPTSGTSNGPVPICGNGVVDQGEICDGVVRGADCASANQDSASQGTLRCKSTCDGYDTSECRACGNAKVETGEDCDGNDLTCEGLGFAPGGTAVCTAQCKIDAKGCCGDGTKAASEACDKTDFGGDACTDLTRPGGNPFTGGQLACSAACEVDTSACTYCGDGTANGNESCDGSDHKGRTCRDQGYLGQGGALACQADCSFDEGQCVGPKCGGTITPTYPGGSCPAICNGGCPDDKTCIIDCTATSCRNVTCPDGRDCKVECTDREACDGSTITGPTTSNHLEVACVGYVACSDLKVTCPSPTGDCRLSCNGSADGWGEACKRAQVTCGAQGVCAVDCDYRTSPDNCDGVSVTCGSNQCRAKCTPERPDYAKVSLACGESCDCGHTCTP